MLNKTRIEPELKRIKRLYDNELDYRLQMYYAKLAILELCGWIETMEDEIIKMVGRRHCQLRYPGVVSHVENNANFTYKCFAKMLNYAVGASGLEKFELLVGVVEIEATERVLSDLWKKRCALAHTYVAHQLPNIDAPNITFSTFQYIYPKLKLFESRARTI